MARPAGPTLGSEGPHAPARRRVHPLTCALCPSYLYSQVKAASSKRFRTSLTPRDASLQTPGGLRAPFPLVLSPVKSGCLGLPELSVLSQHRSEAESSHCYRILARSREIPCINTWEDLTEASVISATVATA